jgi:hypothetical protein
MCGPDIYPTTKHSGTADRIMHCLRPPLRSATLVLFAGTRVDLDQSRRRLSGRRPTRPKRPREGDVRQDRREVTGGVDQPEGRLAAAEAGGLPADRSGHTRLVPRWRAALSDPHQRRAACIRGHTTGQALSGNSGRAQELPLTRALRPVFCLQRNAGACRECVVVGLM